MQDKIVEIGKGIVERAQRAAGVGGDVARPQSLQPRGANARLGGLDQPLLQILAFGAPFHRH